MKRLIPFCFLILLSQVVTFSSAASKLGRYNVDTAKITVSGISSGAAMATQFHFAHSHEIRGVGLFAGVPYLCANGGGVAFAETCMLLPATINVAGLIAEISSLAATGQIDSTSGIMDDKVYIFHGKSDSTVRPASGPNIRDLYQHFGASISTEFSIDAEHGQPTDDYGGVCNRQSEDFHFINNCNYNGAFHMLNHLYGGLIQPSNGKAVNGDFILFDQSEFFTFAPSLSSMDTTGYVYVPSGCRSGSTQCRLHIAFHGCRQNKGRIGDIFAKETGYLEVAEANNIIVLFPQTIATILNPNSCWDWWGYLNIFYPTKDGNQVLAVHRMLQRIVSG